MRVLAQSPRVVAAVAGIDEHARHILAAATGFNLFGPSFALTRCGAHEGGRRDVQLQLLDGAVILDGVYHLASRRHGLHGTFILGRYGFHRLAVERQQPDARPVGARVAGVAHGDDVVVVIPAGHEELPQFGDDGAVEVAHRHATRRGFKHHHRPVGRERGPQVAVAVLDGLQGAGDARLIDQIELVATGIGPGTHVPVAAVHLVLAVDDHARRGAQGLHPSVLRLEDHLVFARGRVIAVTGTIHQPVLLALLGDVKHLAVVAEDGVKARIVLVGDSGHGTRHEVFQQQARRIGG